MASKTAIGIRREMAMNKLHRVMDEMFGEGFTLPTQGRDADLLHAVQLEYIADYLECQAQGVVIPVGDAPPTALSAMRSLEVADKPDYSTLTVKQLKELVQKAGFETKRNTTKAELIDILLEIEAHMYTNLGVVL
jgi:hypothetical protein